MSVANTLIKDDETLAWAQKYIADLNFRITVSDVTGTIPAFIYDPFISNVESNPVKVTALSFTDSANQIGEVSINVNDSKDRVVDRDLLDNGCFVYIQGARQGHLDTTTTPMFFGYVEEIVEDRKRMASHEFVLNGLSNFAQTQNMLINISESARRSSLEDTGFEDDSRFEAHNLIRQIFEDYQVLPVTGAGKKSLRDRMLCLLDGVSSNVKQQIPTINYQNVYASQALGNIADMTGADLYCDPLNIIYFDYPQIDKDITYVKDEFDPTIPPDSQDKAWNTSYVVGSAYVRHGSTRPSDGFANYLIGVATTEGSIEIKETEQQSYTSLVKKDIAQQFTASSNNFFYIAFVAQKVGGGTHANNPSTEKLRVRIIADNNGLPTGGIITQFFIRLRDIGHEPTIITPPPSNQNVRVTPGNKYWIVWYREGISEDDTIRIYHDNRINPTPTHRSATKVISIDESTRVEDPGPNSVKMKEGWFFSTSGPTYAYAIASPERKIVLEMADPLSIKRWGQVDRKVENTGWIHTAKQLGEYMSALLVYSAKKRWIYNFPEVTIPLRPFRAGRAISLRDQILGVTGIDEVDAYSIIQEVSYEVKASEYGLGTNTCSITSLGFQNALDYTIGF